MRLPIFHWLFSKFLRFLLGCAKKHSKCFGMNRRKKNGNYLKASKHFLIIKVFLKLIPIISIFQQDITYELDGCEVLSQLKQVFCSPHIDYNQKVTILTLAPLSWSARKMEKFFECSYHMARQAKILVNEKGLMSSRAPSGKGTFESMEFVGSCQ